MKKFLLLAGLLALAVTVYAVTMPSSQAKVTVDPVTSIGQWQVIPISPSGTPLPTPVPGGSNVTLNGISGVAATSYFDKLSANAGVVGTINGTAATSYFDKLTTSAATATTFSKFTMNATTATAQYLTVTAGSYVLFSNPGSVDIIGDWSTTASTPANLSNTGAVRIQAGTSLAQSVKNGGMILGYPFFIYSNMNTTSPSAQSNY